MKMREGIVLAAALLVPALVGATISLKSIESERTSALMPSLIVSGQGATEAQATVAVPGEMEGAMPSRFARSLPLRGINLSGGEFGSVPGILNKDYTYPRQAYLARFTNLKPAIVRVPFRWERLQPETMSSLSVDDREQIFDFVDHATGNGIVVVLDMHNYARRRIDGDVKVVGSHELPAAALADAWIRIAEDYRGNANVWLGLMNEPYGIPADEWWSAVQEVVVALRKRGIDNKVLVPGISWTGARTWVASGNAGFAEYFRDPGNNFAFEVHQYLDSDSSGTSGDCTHGSAGRVDEAVRWAETRGIDLFFGELAAGDGARCRSEYAALLAKLDASPSVIGWTAWGAGEWWSADYHFRITPGNDGSRQSAHARLLSEHLARGGQPLVP